jgi:hypothetical protein
MRVEATGSEGRLHPSDLVDELISTSLGNGSAEFVDEV